MRHHRSYLVGPLAALALLAAGCSSADGAAAPLLPPVEAFDAGACRTAAPDVLEIGTLTARLGDGPAVDESTKAQLRDTQRRLAATTAATTGREQPVLDAVVQAVGFLRLRADGNTYERSLADDVQNALDELVAECTTGGAAS